MITGNCRGSFAKGAGADRYLPELTWAGSVLGRSIWIARPGKVGRGSGGARQRVAGVCQSGAPRLGSACGLVVGGVRVVRNPPGGQWGSAGLGTVRAMAVAGLEVGFSILPTHLEAYSMTS